MHTDSRAILTRLDVEDPGWNVIPESVSTRIAARSADTAQVVAPARVSASVLVLRDGGSTDGGAVGLEVFVQHRHPEMAFAAGKIVFPGGKLEPDDDDLQACALRELAEETGVLLTRSALRHWAHWITPETEPLRYDTHFYVAAAPPGAEPGNAAGEAVRSQWVRPADAVRELAAGRWAMLPPTRSLMVELTDHDSVARVWRAAEDRAVRPVLPVATQLAPGQWVWRHPSPAGVVGTGVVGTGVVGTDGRRSS